MNRSFVSLGILTFALSATFAMCCFTISESLSLRMELEQFRKQQVQTEIEQRMTRERVQILLDKLGVEELEASAYAPYDNQSGTCNDGTPMTSTGSYPGVGTIAVNPEVYPYGTRFFVPGYGWGVADDTGGMIVERTDLIDLCMMTYQDAMQWGRKRLPVIVVRT